MLQRSLTLAMFFLLTFCQSATAQVRTWPNDSLGRPAPPCTIFDPASNTTSFCSAANPVPTTAPAGATSTGDQFGFGQQWFTGITTFTDLPVNQSVYLAPFFISNTTAVSLRWENGTNFSVWTTTDGGSTWTRTPTSGNFTSPASINRGVGMTRAANGNFIFVGSSGTQPPVFSTPAQNLSAVTSATITGTADPVGMSRAVGNTNLIARAGSPGDLCRSGDGGVTYACSIIPPSNTGFANNGIDSPGSSVWLVQDLGGRVFRSTNDGVSFSLVTTLATGGVPTINGHPLACPSTTICLAASGTNIFRSTDAGLTWAQVGINGGPFAGDPNTKAFGVFDSNNVVLIGNFAAGTQWSQTKDGGLTWYPVPRHTSIVAGVDTDVTLVAARPTGAAIIAPFKGSSGGQVQFNCPDLINALPGSCMSYTKPGGGALVTQASATKLDACNVQATATGAGNTNPAASVAALAGLNFYVCHVDIVVFANAAVTASASPITFTTAGLQSNLVWWGDNSALAQGSTRAAVTLSFTQGSLRTSAPNTTFSITAGGGQATQNLRINFSGFYAQ